MNNHRAKGCIVFGIIAHIWLFFLPATASNPSVGTVKNFIHLLDDSELDFDQELSEYLVMCLNN